MLSLNKLFEKIAIRQALEFMESVVDTLWNLSRNTVINCGTCNKLIYVSVRWNDLSQF